MFTLSEIKDIRKKYKLNENGDIEPTGKEQVKAQSEMTESEKQYIKSAVFLFRKVRGDKPAEMSEEEFLEQIQIQFTSEALEKREYLFLGLSTKLSSLVWNSIFGQEPGSMEYFNSVLAENGKKLQMLQMSTPGGLCWAIRYDITDNKRGQFLQDLNPNSQLYTTVSKSKILTPEQQQRRSDFVNKLMQAYRQCETDKNYSIRAQNEERDMSLVVDFAESRSKGRIEVLSQNAIASIMNLLYAAQNLSLSGQTDYLSVLIDQPVVSDFLRKMRDNNILEQMAQKAQERKANGTLSEHKPTYYETANKHANALISEHPNAIETVRKKLSIQRTFTIPKGDTTNLRRAMLISIYAITQGEVVTRSTDEQGNRTLKIGNGRAPGGDVH